MRKHGVRDVLMIDIDDMAHLILKVSRLFFFKDHNRLHYSSLEQLP